MCTKAFVIFNYLLLFLNYCIILAFVLSRLSLKHMKANQIKQESSVFDIKTTELINTVILKVYLILFWGDCFVSLSVTGQ